MRCGELKGEFLVCEICGLELQVVEKCGDASGTGACCTVDLICCDKPMRLKEYVNIPGKMSVPDSMVFRKMSIPDEMNFPPV